MYPERLHADHAHQDQMPSPTDYGSNLTPVDLPVRPQRTDADAAFDHWDGEGDLNAMQIREKLLEEGYDLRTLTPDQGIPVITNEVIAAEDARLYVQAAAALRHSNALLAAGGDEQRAMAVERARRERRARTRYAS